MSAGQVVDLTPNINDRVAGNIANGPSSFLLTKQNLIPVKNLPPAPGLPGNPGGPPAPGQPFV